MSAWGKTDPNDPNHWHSLLGHSVDVAAAFRAAAETGSIRSRLSALAGREITEVDLDRLSVLAMLHDLGKANSGFQSRRFGGKGAGHILEVGGLLCERELFSRFMQEIVEPTWRAWLSEEAKQKELWLDYLLAILSHHGSPILSAELQKFADSKIHWQQRSGADPFAALAELARHARQVLPRAFEDGHPPLPHAHPFLHLFAGLLQLADWIGSNENWFPFDNGEPSPDRFDDSYRNARAIVREIGFTADHAERPQNIAFETLFVNDNGAPHQPRALQREIAKAQGHIVLLEAETGAGKTEAALLHFAKLYAQGAVNGLYFALPTRVAATQIFERVKRFAVRLFGEGGAHVLLAVPGDARLEEALQPLPLEDDRWVDDQDGASRKSWAMERPKRFLAARIAVGTIDQALLSGLQVRHAHMRAACLSRSLLVVDEVHSSDRYMTAVLEQVLANHVGAGGHALLMSATLGAEAAGRLLSPRKRSPKSDLAAALALDYPLVRQTGHPPVTVAREGTAKTVRIDLKPVIDDAEAVAALAGEAAQAGAKVLVVRNTVSAAQATLAALEAHADAPVLSVAGLRTLHHGRFARIDRRLLDRAVEKAVGRGRADGGLIVIGTQTLEQSLDICADLLITDLCPMDVLLQRIGRLHRHADNRRPSGFQTARAVVLTPPSMDLDSLQGKLTRGFGWINLDQSADAVYSDLAILQATYNCLHSRPIITIPDDNRELVERTTHPQALEALIEQETQGDARWRKHSQVLEGSDYARVGLAGAHSIDTIKAFGRDAFPKEEEHVLTRLGAADRVVPIPGSPQSPFGQPIDEIVLPGHWRFVPGLPADVAAEEVMPLEEGGFTFRVGSEALRYDRLGLRRE